MRLIALVGQVHPPFFTTGGRFARGGRAARPAPAARGVVEHREALLGVVDVVVVEGGVAVALRGFRLEVRLAATPPVHHHDHGERPIAARRQRRVHVQGHAVEGRDAFGVGYGRAETDAVLRCARVAEGRERPRRGGLGRRQATGERQPAHTHEQSTEATHFHLIPPLTDGFAKSQRHAQGQRSGQICTPRSQKPTPASSSLRQTGAYFVNRKLLVKPGYS